MLAVLGKPKMFFNQQHKDNITKSCALSRRGAVPERAEFRLSLSFSWLRFKLHLAVPDLKVAVVLMRARLAISRPARQGDRKYCYQVKTSKAWPTCSCVTVFFGRAEKKKKRRCKSAMSCTCLSNMSHCCSFVRQPSRAEAFHRSLCRNPPSLKTHEAVTQGPTLTKVRAKKTTKTKDRQHVWTWSPSTDFSLN